MFSCSIVCLCTVLLFFLKIFVYVVCDFFYNALFLPLLYPYILLHCEDGDREGTVGRMYAVDQGVYQGR